MIGFLSVVSDEAEKGFLSSEKGQLGEDIDLVSIVDLLIDKVPNEDEMINVRVGSVWVNIVEEKFGRHELSGINKNDKDNWIGIEEII